jgi:hypothetical protein
MMIDYYDFTIFNKILSLILNIIIFYINTNIRYFMVILYI